MSKPRSIAAVLTVAALALASCSSSDDGSPAKTDAKVTDTSKQATTTTMPAVKRPDGPAADVSDELTGGKGVFLGSASAVDEAAAAAAAKELADAGFVEHEYAAEGTAIRYTAEGDLPADGRWSLKAGDTAPYRTRIVVRRPEKAADFNGTVIVEWLNVSGGIDANPDYSFMANEITRRGYAWVGVSAQLIGVEGGPVAVVVSGGEAYAGKGLKAIDPERYGSLHHPGDAYSYDIYTQVARALHAKGASGILGDLVPQRVLAAGESQSAFTLTSYANGVQPLTRQFDGFFVHSRGGAAAPLGEPGGFIAISDAVGGKPTTIRTDLGVPTLILQTESDVIGVLGFLPARQEDTDEIRLWEVAGTAHADRFLIGPLADSVGCPKPINAGPQQFVVRAGLRALDTWVRTGDAPPKADRLETDESGASPAYVRDEDGIVKGGIRTPEVDVPVDVLSGDPSTSATIICILLGSTTPIPDQRLGELYPSAEAYTAAYEKATDAAIAAGFVLKEDRKAMVAEAQPDRISG